MMGGKDLNYVDDKGGYSNAHHKGGRKMAFQGKKSGS